MPPVPQQGSRAGLITALVIFVILFVTTTILFIYQSAETKKAQQAVDSERRKYTEAVAEADLVDPKVVEAIAAGKEAGGKSGIAYALDQRDAAVKLVLGTSGTVKDAAGQAQAAIAAIGKGQKMVTVPQGAGLAPTIGTLVTTIATQTRDKAALEEQLKTSQKAAEDTVGAQKAMLDTRDKQIAELSAKYDAAVAELKTYREGVDTNVTAMDASAKAAIQQAQAGQAKLAQQVTQVQGELKKAQDEVAKLRNRLVGFRINTKEPIVQIADGHIARLPGNGQAYIDLGAGDQVVVGMTFEVYDKYTGIPALGQDGLRETDMPVGKASLEVMRVYAGSSECRIVRKTPGQEVVEGDFIANLVLDAKAKYNFVVYGEFDLDHNGVASTSDAEVVKQLITRWGGKIQTAVNSDTDFLIMGREPVIPELTEEQKQDPVEQKRLEEALAASNAFHDVVTKANQYHVPVMNQNRFLYFCGYYSQSPR
jgi:hypothetical protein